MNYQVDAPLPCEQRVLLADTSVMALPLMAALPASAISAKAANPSSATSADSTVSTACTSSGTHAALPTDFADKNGCVLAPYLADMAQRENSILLLNLAADALSLWLARTYPARMAQGVEILRRAGACGDSSVFVCVPQEAVLQANPAMQAEQDTAQEKATAASELALAPLTDAETQALCAALAAQGMAAQLRRVPASPVLREKTALYTALDTAVVRVHPLCKSFLSEGWQQRPTCVVDGETACAAALAAQGAPRTKLIVRYAQDGSTASVCELPLGIQLSEAYAPTADDKFVLLGAAPAAFVVPQALAHEAVSFTWRYDAITPYSTAVCVADCAATQMRQAAAQSCHNCVLCREGGWHLEGLLTAITQGKAKRDDLALVEDIAPIIVQGALCAFGQAMAQTALSVVQAQGLRAELEAHIVKKSCPSGVCAAFSGYVILPDKCTGCGDCVDACAEDAIEGKDGFIHMLDPDVCEKCGKCVQACDAGAIVRTAQKIRVPKKLTRVGRFS